MAEEGGRGEMREESKYASRQIGTTGRGKVGAERSEEGRRRKVEG